MLIVIFFSLLGLLIKDCHSNIVSRNASPKSVIPKASDMKIYEWENKFMNPLVTKIDNCDIESGNIIINSSKNKPENV